jgi:hypothetical protein
MSKHWKSIGFALAVLGVAAGASYVRVAGAHHGPAVTQAATISPSEITRAAGPLPVMVIDQAY